LSWVKINLKALMPEKVARTDYGLERNGPLIAAKSSDNSEVLENDVFVRQPPFVTVYHTHFQFWVIFRHEHGVVIMQLSLRSFNA